MIAARIAIAVACLAVPTVSSLGWVGDAETRLIRNEAKPDENTAPVAAAANDSYCTPELQRVLRRVLKSCGLMDAAGTTARGCEPVNAQQVATMSGDDFNALFRPMRDHGGIVQFEQGESDLDDTDRKLIGEIFSDQRGASYFFMVARASPEGSVEVNRKLSMTRAENLMSHLRATFKDPELDKEVGLLWLGEEFAQLNEEFCQWRRSGDSAACSQDEINRSAFVAWIDCRL